MQANWRPSRSVTLPAHAERKTDCVCSVYLPQIPAEVHAPSGARVLASRVWQSRELNVSPLRRCLLSDCIRMHACKTHVSSLARGMSAPLCHLCYVCDLYRRSDFLWGWRRGAHLCIPTVIIPCWVQENYGKDNESSIAAVKQAYREVDVEAVFKQYEQESYERLSKLISQQKVVPQEVFSALLKKIYKRQK